MKHIDLNFSTDLTNRNQALLGIGTEIAAAFNAVRAGFGDEFLDKARDQFPASPISFAIDVSQYSAQSGNAHFTLVWGQLAEVDDTDPLNPILTPYGYFLDFLMDLSATTITVAQFKQAVRNRWEQIPKRRVILEAWKRAKNGGTRTEIDVTDTPTAQVMLVEPEFPKHRFATRPEPVLVWPPDG